MIQPVHVRASAVSLRAPGCFARESRYVDRVKKESRTTRAAFRERPSAALERSARNFDKLTPEEVAAIKRAAWVDAPPTAHLPRRIGARPAGPRTPVVAEGDSWFDFPLGTDILDCLHARHPYRIYRFSRRGDTLENMIYGSVPHEPPPIERVLHEIRVRQPAAFLFSGGGNDVAGPELGAFLNHAGSGLDVVRDDYAKDVLGRVFRRYYTDLFRKVNEAKPGIRIVTHGYGHPIPDGRGVNVFIIRLAGPWLKPALERKGIGMHQGRTILRGLMKLFNESLRSLEEEFRNLRFLDLTSEITDKDWRDELHLRNSAYARIADRFAAAITGP
jgi:hypothetical protein